MRVEGVAPAGPAFKAGGGAATGEAPSTRAERTALEHVNRVLSAIRSVNQWIAREKDPDRLAREVCKSLVGERGYDAAWIAVHDDAGLPRLVAEYGWGGTALDALAAKWRDGTPPDCAILARAAESRVLATTCCACLGCPLRSGRHAVVAPLLYESIEYGFLAVSFPEKLEATEEELLLVREIADDLALGLNNLAVSRAREAAEARYSALVEHANVAIVVATEDATVVEANREACAIAGRETLVGMNALELVDKSFLVPFATVLAELQQMGSAHLSDLPVLRADGAIRSLDASASAVQVGSRRLLFGVFRDITEEKKLRAQVMVSDRMASVGTLAAGVAHEINNPLAVVVANLDFALGAAPEENADLRDSLRDAKHAAGRVREIVKDMKLFSRAEEDSRGPVDVERVLDSSIRMAGNEIKHRARLTKRYGNVRMVEANESRLGQVFLNLLVNAAQAIPEGKADVNEISVLSWEDVSGRIVVEIRDTGPGIPGEVLAKLFTPFFTTKPRGVGTGLGLAICLRIVNGLGGEITVESTVGKGTAFRVALPASTETVVAVEETPVAKAASRRGRILVLDDEALVGQSVRRTLESEHEIETFTNGREALDRIRSAEPFDVILCDLMMPVMTGKEFHAALRALAPDQSERVVFMTGGAFTTAARSFLDDPSFAVLEKPYDAQKLREIVNARCR